VRFAQAAQGVPGLVVPRVFDALTSQFVLTMELLEGPTLKEFLEHLAQHDNAERFRVAALLIHALWGPFLREGVIHGDPHPGNFLLLPDGRMGVLDFGAIKVLEPHFVDVNRRLYQAIVKDEPFDSIALSLDSGFVFDDAQGARPVVDELLRIITQPAHSRDFDFATAGINRDLKAHLLKSALKLSGIKPPKQAILFFRGIGGLSQNLENLGARGDYRAVYEGLLSLAP
jgi:predicted unusual protein kinase regulating ubiquinone biosynthesis (AarF/ABC1/UbiB family)